MTNDTTTLNGALAELGETMADNLESMGVTDADASDGLTTLAMKILDIAPSVAGIDFDTSISCESSDSSVIVNTPITITGTLEADYNDTSQTNVDLEGVLTGATVKIYNGQTLLGSTTTNTMGVYTFNYTPPISGNLSISAVFEGTEYYDSCTSSSVSVVVTGLASSSLSLTTPQSTIYVGSSPILSCVLTDSSNNPIANASVKLYKGSNLVSTKTTDSNGEFSHTGSQINSTGTVTYRAVFEGDSIYSSSTSSVNVTVELQTPTLSLTANSTSIYTGERPSLSGSLVDVGGNPIESASVKIYKGANLVSTQTTGSDGGFSITGSATTSSGSITYHAVFDGNSSFNNASSSNVVITVSDPSLSVTATKSILSYSDGESSTITATYDDREVSGKSVVFKKGSTVLDTVTTDSNGQASYTYQSTGAGDVTITVECMNLQETYELEDLALYNTLTDSSADNILIKTGITCSYGTNGLYISNGNWKDLVFTTPITQGMSIEYDITTVGGSQTPKAYCGFFASASQGNTGITNYQPNATGHMKVVYQNNTVQTWLNDTLMTDIGSSSTNPTVTTEPVYYKISTGGQRQLTIKNLKIKAL